VIALGDVVSVPNPVNGTAPEQQYSLIINNPYYLFINMIQMIYGTSIMLVFARDFFCGMHAVPLSEA